LRTLGGPFSALLLQADGGFAPEGSGSTIFELLARTTLVSKAVLLLLAAFSVISWGIIFYKLWTFRRVERQTRGFLDVFRRSQKFSEVQTVCRSLNDSPLVGLFQAGYTELTAQLRQGSAPVELPNGGQPRAAPTRPMLRSVSAIDRALLRASTVEVNKLERRVSFLATTASITPFIGLFGTVVGIMMAFDAIGRTGSTNLSVVAPGIADALIATAFGLAAAIPAAYFYNLLTQRVKIFASEMDDFTLEFLNIVERNFT
jgi:biopolymer transport protein TolQ